MHSLRQNCSHYLHFMRCEDNNKRWTWRTLWHQYKTSPQGNVKAVFVQTTREGQCLICGAIDQLSPVPHKDRPPVNQQEHKSLKGLYWSAVGSLNSRRDWRCFRDGLHLECLYSFNNHPPKTKGHFTVAIDDFFYIHSASRGDVIDVLRLACLINICIIFETSVFQKCASYNWSRLRITKRKAIS